MNGRFRHILSAAAGHPVAPFLFLALLSFLLYSKTAWFSLLPTWDDAEYILYNPLVTGPLDLAGLKAIFTTPVLGNYAPLHILGNALQYRLWGPGPAGYHLVSAAIHAVNACLLFALLQRMTESGRIAFWAALLFAVHPVNVENVAWAAEQKTLFAACCALLTVLAYVRYRQEERSSFLVVAAVAFFLGLLFKVSIIPVPLILVAGEIVRGNFRRGWPATVPFFAAAAVAAILAVRAQMQGGAVEQGVLDPQFLFGTVYPTMVPVLWNYPALILFPAGLSAYYDTTLYHSFLDLPVVVSLAAMVLVLGLVAWKGSGRVRFWAFWTCVLTLPVANLIPLPVYYADRYLYLPAIGMFVLAGIGGEALARMMGPSRRALGAIAAAAVVVLAVFSFMRLEVWRNDLVLWQDTVQKSPNLYKPRLNLGIAYDMAGKYIEAEQELLASLAIRPTEKARYHLAMVRVKMEYYGTRGRGGQ